MNLDAIEQTRLHGRRGVYGVTVPRHRVDGVVGMSSGCVASVAGRPNLISTQVSPSLSDASRRLYDKHL